MSRPGNPYDNATCESFIKTVKQEEIYAGEYRDFEDLLRRVEEIGRSQWVDATLARSLLAGV